jgi:hypothetical protein
MSIATASDLDMAPARPLLMPLLSATVCVALADWPLLPNWRAGGFRAWRLERYLSNNPDAQSNFSDSAKG